MGHRKREKGHQESMCHGNLDSTKGMPLLHFIQIHVRQNFASMMVGCKRKERKRKKNHAPLI
jgi:hypothetical protein